MVSEYSARELCVKLEDQTSLQLERSNCHGSRIEVKVSESLFNNSIIGNTNRTEDPNFSQSRGLWTVCGHFYSVITWSVTMSMADYKYRWENQQIVDNNQE